MSKVDIQKRRRKRNKERLDKYKDIIGFCYDCQESFEGKDLQFHHLGKKQFTISQQTSKGWITLYKEIAKCVLLCNKCHRAIHDGEKDLGKWKK